MFRTGPGPDAGGSNAKEKYLPHCPEKSGTAVMSAADAGDANIQPKPKMKSTRAVSMKRSGQKTGLCVIQQHTTASRIVVYPVLHSPKQGWRWGRRRTENPRSDAA